MQQKKKHLKTIQLVSIEYKANNMIRYEEFSINAYLEEVKDIYQKEGWNAYLKDDNKLIRAFHQSLTTIGAFDGLKLVGFIRVVGDGEHVVVTQDLIVRKEYQKQGIGTHLFKMIWDHYINVRMFQVVTDLEDVVDNHFYPSFGMKKLEDGHMTSYFRP